MSDLLKALNGGKGELDAWLETQNEADVRAAIIDLMSPQETLRDKFAAHVDVPRDEDVSSKMQCELAGRAFPQDGSTQGRIQWEFDWRAGYKMRMADAMLKAR
jgi:hypothetical protein